MSKFLVTCTCNYYNEEVRWCEEPQEVQWEEGPNSSLRDEQPYAQIYAEEHPAGKDPSRKGPGILVTIKLNMTQQGPLQKRKPILPGDAWGKILTEGQRTWSFLSTQHWQGYIWDAGSGFGLPIIKETQAYWRPPRKQPWRCWRLWGILSVTKGKGNWDCSAWRTESSRRSC